MIKKIKLWFVDLFICFRNCRAIWIIENPSKHYMFDRNNDKLLFWIDKKRDILIGR